MSNSDNVLFDTDDGVQSPNTGLCCAPPQSPDNGSVDFRGSDARHHIASETCDDELFLQEAQQQTPASSSTDRSMPENKALEGIIYSDDVSQISDDGMSVSSCASGFIPFSPVRPISSILYNYPSSSVMLSKFDSLPTASSSRSLVASPASSPSISAGRNDRTVGEHSPSLLAVGESCHSVTSSPLTPGSDYDGKSPSLFIDGVSHDGPQSNGVLLTSSSPSGCVIKIIDQSDEHREKPAVDRSSPPVDKDAHADFSTSISAEEDSLSPIHPAKRALGQYATSALVDRAATNSPSSSTSSVGTGTIFSKWLNFRQPPDGLGELQLPGHSANIAQDCNCQSDPVNRLPLRTGAVRRDMHQADGRSRLSLDESRRLRASTAEMRIRQCGSGICRQAPTSASSSEDEGLVATALLDTIKQLRKEKENLANQYEREEEYLTNDLTKKLNKLREEKDELERTLEKQQESVVNKLLVKISKLEHDIKLKQEALDAMRRERVDLENTLEQEQEALVNKLWKRMEKLEMEKRHLQDKLRRRDLQPPSQQGRVTEAADNSNQAGLLTPCRCSHSSTQTIADDALDELHTLKRQVILLRAEVSSLRKQIESYEVLCDEGKLEGIIEASKIAAIVDSVRLKRKINTVVTEPGADDGGATSNHLQDEHAANRQYRSDSAECYPSSNSSCPVHTNVKPPVASAAVDDHCGYPDCISNVDADETRGLEFVSQKGADGRVDHGNDETASDNLNIS